MRRRALDTSWPQKSGTVSARAYWTRFFSDKNLARFLLDYFSWARAAGRLAWARAAGSRRSRLNLYASSSTVAPSSAPAAVPLSRRSGCARAHAAAAFLPRCACGEATWKSLRASAAEALAAACTSAQPRGADGRQTRDSAGGGSRAAEGAREASFLGRIQAPFHPAVASRSRF